MVGQWRRCKAVGNKYIIVGGMPEVVAAYLKTDDFDVVRTEQQVFPLEVKAGISKQKKSLLVYDD